MSIDLQSLTNDSLDAAIVELELVCRGYLSRSIGDLEQFYLDRIDLLMPVVQILRDERVRRLSV